MEKALAYIYAWKSCVRAPPLAGNLHLTSSMLLFFPPHSILPSLPPISPSFPCGALAIPIYLFLLPTKGKALPEYALCCWGLSGMLDSAFFFFSLTLFPALSLLNPTVFICPLFLRLLFLRSLALCSSPWQPGGQIGARLS